jgi:hypothetical protein
MLSRYVSDLFALALALARVNQRASRLHHFRG